MSNPIPPKKNPEVFSISSKTAELGKKLKDFQITRHKLLRKVETLDPNWGIALFEAAPFIISAVLGGISGLTILTFSSLGVVALIGLTLLFVYIAYKHYEKKLLELEGEMTPTAREYASRTLKFAQKKEDEILIPVAKDVHNKITKYYDKVKRLKDQLNEKQRNKNIDENHFLYPAIEKINYRFDNVKKKIEYYLERCTCYSARSLHLKDLEKVLNEGEKISLSNFYCNVDYFSPEIEGKDIQDKVELLNQWLEEVKGLSNDIIKLLEVLEKN